jgi:signal transduction histidine kinase
MPGKIELEVRDEGKGIGHEMVAMLNSGASTGVGFRGMQERVRLIGGKLTIHSNGHGTSVLVSLPINEAALQIGEATPLEPFPGDPPQNQLVSRERCATSRLTPD